MSTNTFPTPLPPWSRPVQTPQIQTLDADGDILLAMDTTYLSQTTPKDSEDATAAYSVALPDGNYERQNKIILVPKGDIPTSAAFRVTGTFAGFTSLLFSSIGQNAVLMWDGAGWHMLGGNAEAEA